MTDFQDIQRLIRLKRFETPGEDFVEDFVNQFRERQRSELLRQSARSLLWERVNTYLDHLLAPKWMTAGSTAAVCLLGTWLALTLTGTTGNPGHTLAALDSASVVVPPVKPSLQVDSPLIREVAANEDSPIGIESVLISTQLEDQSLDAKVAGIALDAANATPVGFFPRVDQRSTPLGQ